MGMDDKTYTYMSAEAITALTSAAVADGLEFSLGDVDWPRMVSMLAGWHVVPMSYDDRAAYKAAKWLVDATDANGATHLKGAPARLFVECLTRAADSGERHPEVAEYAAGWLSDLATSLGMEWI